LFRYPSLAILYEADANKHEWLQTNEMVKVGMAWRFLDVPTTEPPPPDDSNKKIIDDNPIIAGIMAEISKVDEDIVKSTSPTNPGISAAAVGLYLKRVELVNKLLPNLPAAKLEEFYRQKADNLQAACLASPESDTRALTLLRQFKSQLIQQS